MQNIADSHNNNQINTNSTIQESVSTIGERAAMGGYKPQYDEFARLVYTYLLKDELVSIHVADDKVGTLDDIYLEARDEIHAYQMKWSLDDGAVLSFAGFKDIFGDIANGWKQIKDANPRKRVIPHFITCKSISSHDSIKDDNGKKAGNFLQLTMDVFPQLKEKHSIDSKWENALSELCKEATELSDEEFAEFWTAFCFTANYQGEGLNIEEKQQSTKVADMLDIENMIIQMAADRKCEVVKTKEDIIRTLGWHLRFNTHFNHSLYIDENYYEPIQSTINEIEDKINNTKSGYIYLEGGPGTGKSSLLSYWANHTSYTVISYYAFDFRNPSSASNNNWRGEAAVLYHDLVILLKEQGCQPQSDEMVTNDLQRLRIQFLSQLAVLGNEYKQQGIKTIFVIDGLDHIPREYKNCVEDFIGALPLPNDLPEGVTIILGSQNYDRLYNLPKEIEVDYKNSANRICIAPLTKENVYSVLIKAKLQNISIEKLLDTIYEKSQGHPLYVHYLLESIRESEDPLKSLQEAPSMDNDIEVYYRRMLGDILDSEELYHALGLMARISGNIRWGFVKEWGLSRNIQEGIARKVKPLFVHNKKREEYSFFHNSFRIFLINETATSPLDNGFDCEIDKQFYSELADKYINSNTEKFWRSCGCLYKSGRYDEFIDMTSPDKFQELLLDWVSIEEILDIIYMGIAIAREREDAYLMLRYCLLDMEMGRRSHVDITPLSHADTFIKIGLTDRAKDIIRNDRKLHCTKIAALDFALDFLCQGDEDEARFLFDLAFPILKMPSKHFGDNYNEDFDLVKKWIYVAGHLIESSIIENAIEQYTVHFNKRIEKSDYSRIKLLLTNELLSAYLHQGKTNEFINLYGKVRDLYDFDPEIKNKLYVRSIPLLSTIDEVGANIANDFFTELYEICKREPSIYLKIRTAKIAYLLGKDKGLINDCISEIKLSDITNWLKQDIGLNKSMKSYRTLYDFVHLASFLNYDINLELVGNTVPLGSDDYLLVEFARKLCIIAKKEGEIDNGNTYLYDFNAFASTLIRFLNKDRSIRNTNSHSIKSYRAEVMQLVIRVMSKVGENGVKTIGNLLFKTVTETEKVFPPAVIREIAMDLYRRGYDPDKCICLLEQVERDMYEYEDQNGRLEANLNQGKAWIELGFIDRGIGIFKENINDMLSVGYSKDPQPAHFMKWVERVNAIDPGHAQERLLWMIQRLPFIERTTDGSTHLYVVDEFIEAAFKHNKATGVKVIRWMLDAEQITFIYAIENILFYWEKEVTSEEELDLLLLFYDQIFLYYDSYEHGHPEILKVILKTVRRVCPKNEEAYLQRLEHSIRCKSKMSAQETLLNIIIGKQEEEQQASSYVPDNDVDEITPIQWIERGEEAWEKGEKGVAKECSLKALAGSESYDWSARFTNQNIVKALTILKKVDNSEGKTTAYRKLEQDIPKGITYNFLEDSFTILPLLVDEVDTIKAYSEIFCYMQRLLGDETAAPSVTPDISEAAWNVSDAISYVLCYLTTLPTHSVKHTAECLLAIGVDKGRIEWLNQLQVVDPSNKSMLFVGKFLEAMHSENLKSVYPFISDMTQSTNYQNRCYARDIASTLGISYPKAPVRPLPITYEMYIPEENSLFSMGNSEPENWGTRKMGAMELTDVEAVSRRHLSIVTGIPEHNIAIRVVQLMKDFGSDPQLGIIAEKKLKHHLDSLRLHINYPRPLATVVIDAMMEVVTELIDANVTTTSDVRFIMEKYDFDVLLWNESAKPDFIHTIQTDRYSGVSKKWFEEIDYSPRFNKPLEKYGDFYVIGEHTFSFCDTDYYPQEEYKQMIICENIAAEMPDIFGTSAMQWLSNCYHVIPGAEPHAIVCRHSWFSQFGIKCNWIAFNPRIAVDLGWHPSDKGLFAWENENDELMVRSVYWRCGNTQSHERSFSESQEGWIVLASKKALEMIKANQGNLKQVKYIERRKYQDSKEIKSHVLMEESL